MSCGVGSLAGEGVLCLLVDKDKGDRGGKVAGHSHKVSGHVVLRHVSSDVAPVVIITLERGRGQCTTRQRTSCGVVDAGCMCMMQGYLTCHKGGWHAQSRGPAQVVQGHATSKTVCAPPCICKISAETHNYAHLAVRKVWNKTQSLSCWVYPFSSDPGSCLTWKKSSTTLDPHPITAFPLPLPLLLSVEAQRRCHGVTANDDDGNSDATLPFLRTTQRAAPCN